MPPYTRCALRVGRLEKCSKEVGVRCCRSTGIVTSCINKAKVAEFLQTRFRIDLKSAVNVDAQAWLLKRDVFSKNEGLSRDLLGIYVGQTIK